MKKISTLLLLTLCIRLSAQYSFNYLEELNPTLFQSDFLTYNQSTAIYSGLLAEVSYWSQPTFKI